MPETFLEKINRAFHSLRRRTLDERHVYAYYSAISRQKNIGKIWFYPDVPEALGYSIAKVCAQIGLKMTQEASTGALLGVHWKDDTFTDAPPPTTFKVLNANCRDISKVKVEQVFESVFGYPIAVDPLTYVGRAACKSNINAAHDGTVIECPINQTEPGRVYEKLVDNAVSDYLVEDIRIPVVGTRLPFAYLKRRFIKERFSNSNRSIKRVPIDSVISEREQELILRFAAEMGLDWGEVDAMRDRGDGRLYLVDVNKTPGGPPTRMAFFPKIAAVNALAEAFEAEFINSKD